MTSVHWAKHFSRAWCWRVLRDRGRKCVNITMWEKIFKRKRCHVKVHFKTFPIRMKVTSRAEPPPGSASARARWRWPWAPSPPPGWCSGQCSPPPAAPGEEEKSCYTSGVHQWMSGRRRWRRELHDLVVLSFVVQHKSGHQSCRQPIKISVTLRSPSRTSRSRSPSGTADCGGPPQGTWGWAGLGDKNGRECWILTSSIWKLT